MRCCSRQPVDPIEGQFLQRVFIALGGQAVRRIGKVERAVGFVDQVVGTVQPLSLVVVAENGQLGAGFERFQPVDLAAGVARDGEAAVLVDGHTV